MDDRTNSRQLDVLIKKSHDTEGSSFFSPQTSPTAAPRAEHLTGRTYGTLWRPLA